MMFWKEKSYENAASMCSLLIRWNFLILWMHLCSSVSGQHYAYISNMGVFGNPNNTDMSVIDLATNTVVATVPVGTNPQGVSVNPAGTMVYVANTGSNDYTVIDTTTYKATTIPGPGGVGATGAAVHPDGTRIETGTSP